MTPLLHMTTARQWRAATERGSYSAPSLVEAGFIHLSTVDQVQLPANALFPGRTDIVLLWIDTDLLVAPLRWEPGQPGDPDGMLFPHLYGPIEVEAVLTVTPYPAGPDGRFGRPTDADGHRR